MKFRSFLFVTFLLFAFSNAIAKDLTLNSAISIASSDLMKSPKLGKWKKIVLMDFSDSIEWNNYIYEELSNKLITGFTIIDRKNLGILREELDFQHSDKVDKTSIRKIGAILGVDFIIWGTFKNENLSITVENVKEGTTDFSRNYQIDKKDPMLEKLSKNTLDNCFIFCDKVPNINKGIKIATAHLTGKITEEGVGKVLLNRILSDKKEIGEKVLSEIKDIFANDLRLALITNRDDLDKIEKEMNYQQISGEVDENTIKERGKLLGAHAIVYGNIRPIGDNYRLFLQAINVENAKVIATHSQIVKGNKKDIKDIVPPSSVSNLEANALSSDRIKFSWSLDSNTRYFAVYRIAEINTPGKFLASTEANSFIDFLDLKPENKYCYKVLAFNTGGAKDSEVVCTETLGKPSFSHNTLLKKQVEKDYVEITWNKVLGAISYEILRKSENERRYEPIKKINDTIFKDSGLESSSFYNYTIVAKNSAGADSSMELKILTKPKPPIIYSVKPSANKIEIKWEDNQKNISHYELYINDEKTSEKIYEKNHTLHNLKSETSHSFKIKAINESGDSEFSERFSEKTLGKPSQPTSFVVFLDSSDYEKKIKLKWSSVPSAEWYSIYRNDDTLLSQTHDTIYDERYSSLKDGMKYLYAVSASNAAGGSGRKYSADTIYSKPLTPEIFKNEIGENKFYIEWKAVPSAYKYKIIKDGKIDTANITDTYIRKLNLPYNEEASYCVIAINKMSESECSEEIYIETLKIPQNPNDLEAKAVSRDSILLRWNLVEKAKNYTLYLCEKDRWEQISCDKELYSGPNTNYIHSGLNANTKYEYAVTAINTAGESKERTTTNAKTFILPPSNIKLEPFGLDSIKISWKADGAEYFHIYRKINGDSIPIVTNIKSTEYIDRNNIEPKTQYTYFIVAVDDGQEIISKGDGITTSSAGNLILKNENNNDRIITAYEIIDSKNKIIKKEENLSIQKDQTHLTPVIVGKNHKITITTNNGSDPKKDREATFNIEENKEVNLVYRATLRKK